jgi:nitrite reductase/ring-hydroxylating ferredoxin subunit
LWPASPGTRGSRVFVDLGPAESFENGKAQILTINGRQIGVIRSGDEVFALRNICPHEYAPVCAGYSMKKLFGEKPGQMEVDEETLFVVCPWHGWEFDARTGRAAWGNSTYRLKTYPAKIEDGNVFVEVKGPSRSSAAEKAAVADAHT